MVPAPRWPGAAEAASTGSGRAGPAALDAPWQGAPAVRRSPLGGMPPPPPEPADRPRGPDIGAAPAPPFWAARRSADDGVKFGPFNHEPTQTVAEQGPQPFSGAGPGPPWGGQDGLPGRGACPGIHHFWGIVAAAFAGPRRVFRQARIRPFQPARPAPI
jgi:hypothetical protein